MKKKKGTAEGIWKNRKVLLLKSRLFRRIFLTYLAFIAVFLAGYCTIAIIDYNANKRGELDSQFSAQAGLLATVFDNELVQARYMAASINNSWALKNVYTQSLSNTSVDSYIYAQAEAQMMGIQSQMNNLAISNLLLVFHNSNRIYTSSSVISLKDEYQNQLTGTGLTVDTVSNLLQIENQNLLMQKEYLIYYTDYNYSYKGVSKGTILVLMNPDALVRKITGKLNDPGGFCVMADGVPVLSGGIQEGIEYPCASSIDSAITYLLYVPEDAYQIEFSGMILTTLGIGILFGLLAVAIAWYTSFRHYLPYEHIARIVNPEQGGVANDEQEIVNAMKHLITEKNETNEKMVEIRPYAQKGVLQDVLHGNLDPENLKILYQDNPGEMKFLYFAVAVVNLVLRPAGEGKEASSVILHRAEDSMRNLSDEKCLWYSYARDSHHLYCIVSFDDVPEWEELFYQLQRHLERAVVDPDCRITIGVSLLKDEMGQLQDACGEAEEALTYMITGGRSQVYFYDPGIVSDEKEYYFPKDAVKVLSKLLASRDLEGIHGFFSRLLEMNTKQYEVSARSMELLVDELHVTTIYVMREFSMQQDTPIVVKKVTGAATIEEILTYYQTVYETIIRRLPDLVKEDEALENCRQQILDYIDQHYLDKDLSLSLLVEKFHVTNKFISSLCNATYGKNYLQYVQEKRIYYAQELIRQGGYSLEEVACRSGYSSTLTFRRNFKSILGMNPSDFAESRAGESEKQPD